jgi:hypothetical protein
VVQHRGRRARVAINTSPVTMIKTISTTATIASGRHTPGQVAGEHRTETAVDR